MYRLYLAIKRIVKVQKQSQVVQEGKLVIVLTVSGEPGEEIMHTVYWLCKLQVCTYNNAAIHSCTMITSFQQVL